MLQRRHIKRHGYLWLSIALLFTVFAGLVPSAEKAEAAPAFAYGADVSWLPQMEAHGYKFYYRDGRQGDLLKILKEDFGINSIRIRTWVNPSRDPWNGSMDQAASIALAKRAANEGMSVMIDFHYGDTWNSVGTQVCPAAWQNLSYNQLRTTLYDYTYNFLTALKNQGVTPAWVQVGNETNTGLCKPMGSISNPSNMVGLFNAGYDAVKAVFPSTIAMVHLSGPQKAEVEHFLDTYFNRGGKTDMIAFSSYASLGNQPAVASRVEYFRNKYNKPVMMSEVGGPWDRASEGKAKLTNWINLMKRIGGNGTGVFYWEPQSPPGFNAGYNMGAVDSNMRWTVAMDAYREASGAGSGGGTYIKLKNRATGLFIDGLGNTANGSIVGQWNDSSSTNQQWVIESAGSYVKIKNRQSGLYLDGLGATSNGADAGLWSGNSSINQQWTQKTAGGYVKFKNRATGLYLDGMGRTANGSNLGQWSSGSSYNQQWQLVAP